MVTSGVLDPRSCLFFFFNVTATTEIYTLSLHDALPISRVRGGYAVRPGGRLRSGYRPVRGDRKSTRLNSSHANISYAVFCLKKKTMGITAAKKKLYFGYGAEAGHMDSMLQKMCARYCQK